MSLPWSTWTLLAQQPWHFRSNPRKTPRSTDASHELTLELSVSARCRRTQMDELMKSLNNFLLLGSVIAATACTPTTEENMRTQGSPIDQPLLRTSPMPQGVNESLPEPVLYATVQTDSPNRAIAKLTSAFTPATGKRYDVEVRITPLDDERQVIEETRRVRLTASR